MQQFKNFADSTLNGGIDNSVTSIVVVDGSRFPSDGEFYVVVDSEIILVSARSGNTLTVSRGQEGTTAVSHSSGATITWVLTAATLDGFRKDNCDWGLSFTAGYEGRLLFDDSFPYVGRDSGSTFDLMYPLSRTVVPLSSAFTSMNLGSSTVTDVINGIKIEAPADSGDNLRLLDKVLPSTPCTITCRVNAVRGDRYHQTGLYIRDSISGKLQSIHILPSGGGQPYIQATRWNAPNSFNSHNVTLLVENMFPMPTWLRIHHDGTTLYFRYSVNGLNYKTLYSLAKNTFLTNGPDKIGLFVNSIHASLGITATFQHYEET